MSSHDGTLVSQENSARQVISRLSPADAGRRRMERNVGRPRRYHVGFRSVSWGRQSPRLLVSVPQRPATRGRPPLWFPLRSDRGSRSRRIDAARSRRERTLRCERRSTRESVAADPSAYGTKLKSPTVTVAAATPFSLHVDRQLHAGSKGDLSARLTEPHTMPLSLPTARFVVCSTAV